MMRFFALIFFILMGANAWGQLHEGFVTIGWNTMVPLSNKEFISTTSSTGMRVGYSKFIKDRFGFGVEGAFNTLDEYVPRQTYEYPGGAVTTDKYNYLYYYTLMANAQHYIIQGKNFIPYASLGMGLAFSEYHTYYNVYSEADSKASFAIRPEIGTLFRVREYAKWGLKTSMSYDYATNKSDYFETDNFSGVSFQVGLILFTE